MWRFYTKHMVAICGWFLQLTVVIPRSMSPSLWFHIFFPSVWSCPHMGMAWKCEPPKHGLNMDGSVQTVANSVGCVANLGSVCPYLGRLLGSCPYEQVTILIVIKTRSFHFPLWLYIALSPPRQSWFYPNLYYTHYIPMFSHFCGQISSSVPIPTNWSYPRHL